MARLIGDAYIVIYPQTDQFGPLTAAAVKKATAAVKGTVPVSPVLDKAAVATVQAEIKGLGGETIDLDAALSTASMGRIRSELKALTSQIALGAQLDPDALAKIQAQLKAITDQVKLGAALDPAALAKIELALRSIPDAVLGVKISPATIVTIEALRAQIDEMTADREIGIAINEIMYEQLQEKLKDLTATVPVKIDPVTLAATIAGMNAYMRSIQPIQIPVAVSAAQLAALKAGMDAFFKSGIGAAIVPVRLDPASLASMNATMNDFLERQHYEVMLNTAPAMTQIAFLAAYAKKMLSAAGGDFLDFTASTAGALTFQAAAASLVDTFAKMRANIVAANALAGTTTTLWTAFFTGANTGWGVLTSRITLFAGVFDSILPHILSSVSVWHLAADWVVEFGAVFIPATIAVTAFGAAVAPVVQDALLRLQAMNEAASALGVSIGKLGSGALGATGPMQKLQDQLQPAVWEVFGDALNVMTSKTGAFAAIVKSVTTVVEDLAARMTAAFSSNGMNTFLQNGALDFQRFGTIIGNIGGAIGDFIKDVPGYAEIIEQLFVQVSKLVENIVAFSGPVIKAGLALHGFILYMGLATTAGVALLAGLGNVLKGFFTFATEATSISVIGGSISTAFAGAGKAALAFGKNLLLLATNPYVVGLVAIGLLAYDLALHFDSASTSVQNFISKVTAVGNMSGGDALNAIPTDLGQISNAIKVAASSQGYQEVAKNWTNLGNVGNAFAKELAASGSQIAAAFTQFNSSGLVGNIAHIGDAIKDLFTTGPGIQQQVTDNVKALESAFNQLSGQEQNLLTVTAQLMEGQIKGQTASFSYTQSLGILNAAGVQASDSLQLMQTKVSGLITGWAQFGLSASQIGNSVNALALQTEMGQTSISKLTSAYSNFISTVTSGESSFATFGEGLGTLQQALSATGASGVSFSDTLGKFTVKGTAAGAAMDGLSQSSLNLRGAFASEITNATSLFNSLTTLSSVSVAGAQGQNLLAQAGKDMVAELLPLAKGSQAAMAEVSALAQLAGGPATTSFQQLSQWVGNVKDPMSSLNKIEQQLTVSSSNLYQDTMNLAGAMNQTLTSAISTAIFTAEKGPQAMANLANALADLANKSGSVDQVKTALEQSIPALTQMSGSSKLAEDQFIAMAGAFKISAAQATAMWNAVAPNAAALKALTAQSQALTSATNANLHAFAAIPAALATSGQGYNQLWAVIAKNDTQLVSNAGYASIAKNAFISFAENGLGFTSKAANTLWASNKAQNLIDLAGKATTTKASFVDLAKSGLGLTTTAANQLWTELRLQYLDTLVAKGKGAEDQFINLAKSGLDLTTSSATSLWNTLKNQYLDTLAAKASTTAGQFANVAKQFGISNSAAVTLWASLKALPPNVRVAIDETIAGGGAIKVQGDVVTNTATGIATSTVTGEQTFNGYAYAAGGIIGAAGGGAAGRDSKLAMVAPGELIIPTSHAPKFADMARRSSIPGFAAGGVMGEADSVAALNAHILPSASKTGATIVGMAGEALVSAMASQLQSVAASLASISLAGVSNASAVAALESAAAKAGWTGTQWTALYNVEMDEAGFNLGAVNSSSGAYGMAQFINGPSEYAQYGGNATTAAGQAVAMVNYIKSRYGTPTAALQHERQFGWYNSGGRVPNSAGGMISEPVFGFGKFSGMPYSFAENGPEQVLPGGAAVAQNQGLPGMTTYQANTLISLMQQQNKLLAQLPYSQAQAINQAQASGVRRGYFATSG